MSAPVCECGKVMEPTAALAFWYPVLRGKDEAFPWACRHCRTLRTDPYVPGEASCPA